MPPKRSIESAGGPVKRARLERSATPRAGPRSRALTPLASRAGSSMSGRPVINAIPSLPTQRLNVYVFGSGTICELGLGPKVTEVKRPRLNPLLPIDEVGIVAVSAGGAHVVAIDHAGKLWSWGQNDSGALGRDSKLPDDYADMEEDDDILNPAESAPGRVDVPENLTFVAIGASDNVSAAITSDGHVWAWGTFIDDGDKAFKSGVEIQKVPVLIPQLRGAVALAGGKDHLLVLDKYGDVHAWGTGQNFQLGHEVNARLRTKTFGPLRVVGVNNVKSIAAGEYHSFAIDHDGQLWSWGLNNFGQCAIPEAVGSGASVQKPTLATFFKDMKIAQVDGGNHHSLILTEDGDVYAVGEMNFQQLGIAPDALPESTVREKNGTPSYVPVPTKLTKGSLGDDEECDVPKFKLVAAGTDHSLALSVDGSAWTWGFGEVYQLGHGKPAGEDSPEDEPVPTRIKNTATTGVTMVYAGAGGQFSVLAGLPKEVNGTNGTANGH